MNIFLFILLVVASNCLTFSSPIFSNSVNRTIYYEVNGLFLETMPVFITIKNNGTHYTNILTKKGTKMHVTIVGDYAFEIKINSNIKHLSTITLQITSDKIVRWYLLKAVEKLTTEQASNSKDGEILLLAYWVFGAPSIAFCYFGLIGVCIYGIIVMLTRSKKSILLEEYDYEILSNAGRIKAYKYKFDYGSDIKIVCDA